MSQQQQKAWMAAVRDGRFELRVSLMMQQLGIAPDMAIAPAA